MKFLLLLAVFVAASFAAAPQLPTTFIGETDDTVTISGNGQTKTFKETGELAEDNANKKKLQCGAREGNTTYLCRLTVYDDKKLYIYGRPANGPVINCTSHALPANASTYRNEWVWVPESKSVGDSVKIGDCKPGQAWELKFQDKIDLKVSVDTTTNQPVALYGKISNSTGYVERISCFKSFSTTIVDPSKLTPPTDCKPGLPVRPKEEDIFFHGMF